MSTLLIIVSVLLAYVLLAGCALVFALCMGAAAHEGDASIQRAHEYDRLRAEADRLASMPQGLPTDDMENDMAIEHESCWTCEYRGTACNICPHMLLPVPVHVNHHYNPDKEQ